MKKLKVLGYCRVSSESQKLKDNSIKSQISYINEYCSRLNYDLVNIFKDEGISGKIKNRDGLNELFDVIKKDNIDCLIVYSISRLSRKLKDVLEFIDVLEKNDVKFISVKENINCNEVVGKLMLGLLGSVNEFEVNLLGDRIKDVKRYKKSKKEVYGGKILFGWYRRGNKLVRNIKELEVLKLIVKLREEDNLSYFKISDYLNDNNINSKEKKKWYGSSCRKIYLDNRFLLENV
jgi:site-specific DNA recombinase